MAWRLIKRGANKYLSKKVLKELDNIMKENNVETQQDALEKMAKYSVIGRERGGDKT